MFAKVRAGMKAFNESKIANVTVVCVLLIVLLVMLVGLLRKDDAKDHPGMGQFRRNLQEITDSNPNIPKE